MSEEPTGPAKTTANRTVRLFVRSGSPSGERGRPSEIVDRLETLRREDVVREYSVSVWGREVGLSTPTTGSGDGRAVLERVAALRSWAAEAGVELEGFQRRETTAPTGETHTALALPAVVLAEYTDGALSNVVPHAAEGRTRTVDDRLEALSSAQPPDRRPEIPLAQPP
jgi:hypothetical protein